MASWTHSVMDGRSLRQPRRGQPDRDCGLGVASAGRTPLVEEELRVDARASEAVEAKSQADKAAVDGQGVNVVQQAVLRKPEWHKAPTKVNRAEAQLARQELAEAMEEHDVDRLRRALPVAASLGVPRRELDAALRVLNFDVQRALTCEVESVREVVAQLAESVALAEARALEAERTANSMSEPIHWFAGQPVLDPQGAEEWIKQAGAFLEERVWSGLQRRVHTAAAGAVKQATRAIEAVVEELRVASAHATPSPNKQLRVRSQLTEHEAATRIQARCRGMCVRNRQKNTRQEARFVVGWWLESAVSILDKQFDVVSRRRQWVENLRCTMSARSAAISTEARQEFAAVKGSADKRRKHAHKQTAEVQAEAGSATALANELRSLDIQSCRKLRDALQPVFALDFDIGDYPVQALHDALHHRVESSLWRNICYETEGSRRLRILRDKEDHSEQVGALPFGSVFDVTDVVVKKIADGTETWVRVHQAGGADDGWIKAEVTTPSNPIVNCIKLADWQDHSGRICDVAFRGQPFPLEGMYSESYPGARDICLVSASGDNMWRELNIEMLFRNMSTATVFEQARGSGNCFADLVARYLFNVATHAKFGTSAPKRLIVTVNNTANFSAYPRYGPQLDDVVSDLGTAQYRECLLLKQVLHMHHVPWNSVVFMTAFQFLREFCSWTPKDCQDAATSRACRYWCGEDGLTPFADLPLEKKRFTMKMVRCNLQEAFPAVDVANMNAYLRLMGDDIHRRGQQVLAACDVTFEPLNEYHQALLHFASQWGLQEFIVALYSRGASLEAKDDCGQTPLHVAARHGHKLCIIALHELGASLEARDALWRTPMHVAAQYGQADCIMALHTCGSGLEVFGHSSWTPMHTAACYGAVESIRALDACGASVESEDDYGKTPMHVAAQYNQDQCLNACHELGASVDAIDMDGHTPMHEAAQRGNLQSMQALECLGASMDSADKHGQTPAHVAAQCGQAGCVRLLRSRGASLEHPDDDGQTPMHLAAQCGQTQCAEELLSSGANLESLNAQGQTPLHVAAQYGQIECLQAFLKAGARGEVQAPDGPTPMHVAAQYGQSHVVRALSEAGASCNVRGTHGQTPLHVAVQHGHTRCVHELHLRGAIVDFEDEQGRTPLHVAVQYGQAGCVDLLRSCGANLEHPERIGQTPMHLAAQYGNTTCIQDLQSFGAKLDALDKFGQTPVHVAAAFGKGECLHELIEFGVDSQPKDSDGRTPTHVAAQYGQTLCLKMLLSCVGALDSPDKYGQAPVHVAARYGQANCFWALVDAGASLEVRNRDGQTPMHVAIQHGQAAFILDVCQSHGTALDFLDENGQSLWHVAAQYGHASCINVLRSCGASSGDTDEHGQTPNNVAVGCRQTISTEDHRPRSANKAGGRAEARDQHGRTPMHVAAQYGQSHVVRALVEAGATCNAPGTHGQTPLHVAVRHGHARCVPELHLHGAVVDFEDEHGRTPLHVAVQCGQARLIGLLQSCGANLEHPDDDVQTPMHLAAQCGQTQCAEELLSSGANLESLNVQGQTPLHVAAQYGHTECLQAFLKAGARGEVQAPDGQTPMHVVAQYGQSHLVQALVEAGASCNVRDTHGQTPLHVAVQHGHTRCVLGLHLHGAFVDFEDDQGRTPLHVAVQHGQSSLIGLLQSCGANLDFAGRQCETPMHLAAKYGQSSCIQELVSCGANVESLNAHGQNPMHVAAQYGQAPCLKMLLRVGAACQLRDWDGRTPMALATDYGHTACIGVLQSHGLVDDDGRAFACGVDHASAKIFFGGLPQDATVDSVRAYFNKFGKLTDVALKYHPKRGTSRGWGFVTFENPAVAQQVLDHKEGHWMGGKSFECKTTTAKGETEGAGKGARGSCNGEGGDWLKGNNSGWELACSADDGTSKIFVGGLPRHATEDSVRAYFSWFGKLTDVALKYHPKRGTFKGWAFVTFQDPATAQQVLTHQKGHWLDGKSFECKAVKLMGQGEGAAESAKGCWHGDEGGWLQADGSGLEDASCKVFVGCLPRDVTEDALRAHFSKFGKLTDVMLKYNPLQGRHKGFGFLTFQDPSVAQQVLSSTENHWIGGERITCKAVTSKGDGEITRSWAGGGRDGWRHHDGNGCVPANGAEGQASVSGLPCHASKDALREHFSTFGTLTEVTLKFNPQRRTNTCIVTFQDPAVVELVCDTRHWLFDDWFDCEPAKAKGIGKGAKECAYGRKDGWHQDNGSGDGAGASSGDFMQAGTVKSWFEDKGYGFIVPDGSDESVFVHRTRLQDGRVLELGARVHFDSEWNPEKKRNNVTRLTGAVPRGCGKGQIGNGTTDEQQASNGTTIVGDCGQRTWASWRCE